MAERIISLKQVTERTSLSKTHTYRLINAGLFPRPIPLGPHRVGFVESEIEKWIASRVRARDEGPKPQ